tara:strand:- start:634 stop:2922 length:2289 start_codon:yes stop_codon:yes gene_type:complete
MTDELISNGFSLDLSDNIPVPINLSIADAKDPSKRKRNFSKTITLPGTMTNMEFFSGSFSFSVTDTGIVFDATAKAPIILYKRGISIMPDGVIKLNSVKITNKIVDSFECQIFSETVDYFLLLDSIKVNELDWTDYTHTLTRPNQIASWSAAIGSGYYYGLIERGLGRPGATIFRTTDLVPYVYSKEVMVKIFEWLDIPFTSDFMDTTRYKSKLFGYGGGELVTISAAAINDRKVEIDNGDFTRTVGGVLGGGSAPDYYSFPVGQFNPFKDNPQYSTFTKTIAQDNSSQWDDGEITAQFSGNYNLSITMALDYQYNYGAGTFIIGDGFKLSVAKNGGGLYQISFTPQSTTSDNGTFTLVANSHAISLESGDVLFFGLQFGGARISGATTNVTLDITTSTPITIDLISTDTTVTDGSTVELNKFLPDIKCSTFLLGEILNHNLYLSDPDDDGNVIIEPLSGGFYQPTSTFDDWTELVDHDKDVIVKPTANDYSKVFNFKYKKNKDQDAKTYLDKYEREYGDLAYEQGSYYAKGEQKIELPWSTIIPYQIADGIHVPRFIKIQNGVMSPNKGEPRVMMRNGLKAGNWTFRDALNPANSQQLTTYPSVHHFDNWSSPGYDLNFQLVYELFYTATNVTTVNSFSEYYFESVNEMTNAAGKSLLGYFKLNPYLVKTIDFSKLKMINGTLWRLNEVLDFDDNIQATTKCELIKVLNAKSPNRTGYAIPIVALTFDTGNVTSPSGNGSGVGVVSGGFNSSNQYNNVIKG